MRVDVTPRRAEIVPGHPQPLTITIANTSNVIGGYAIRVLGADPGWVQLQTDRVSLFPDQTDTVQLTVTAPVGVPAGPRRIAVQVRELNPPERSTIVELDLEVPAARSVRMRVDPLTVTAGHRATFSVIVENTGNTMLNARLGGDDPENKVRFTFNPEAVTLAPGEHAVADLKATAPRHVTGSPTVRMLGLYLDDVPTDSFFTAAADADDLATPARGDTPPLANATFLQRAVLARGALSLLGLLAAVTVFAVLITLAMSRLVGQSTADRNLALQIAAAQQNSPATGTSGVAGTVRLLTSGDPVPAVAVSVFDASDTSTPVATTATDSKGSYRVTNLAAGKYKLSFRGAGFIQLWYPGATSDADAKTVTLTTGQLQAGLDVTLGGVPASIGGKVTGDDVADATVYLETTGTGATGGTSAASAHGGLLASPLMTGGTGSAPGTPGNGVPGGGTGAVVTSVPVGSDGTFSIVNVPSPSVYELVVTKAGYATSTQRIDIGAGENRSGVQLQLSLGDGLIAGTVSSPTGPLGGVTVTATAGQSSADTVSLSVGDVGAFTLRSLPTPASFTITASKPGYASQTLTLSLAAGQKLTGVAITLSTSSTALDGAVTAGGAGATGVIVTATNGQLTVSTVTETTPTPGHWQLGGLPVPGTYTVTFSRSDLSAQTISIDLGSTGAITSGSQVAQLGTDGSINTTMHSATEDVFGTVTQTGAAGCSGGRLGEATVTLTSGTSTYTTTTASSPGAQCGAYYFDRIPPGTYTLTVSAGTGTSPSSRVLTLAASDTPKQADVTLASPASLSGTLSATDSNGHAVKSCGWTVNLYAEDQYPTVVSDRTTTTCSGSAVNGTFSFAGVAAGTYVVEVRLTPGSSALASKVVRVGPSETVDAGTIKVSSGG